MLTEYKNKMLWSENYKGSKQISRTVGRPVGRENPRALQTQSADCSVGRSLLRSTELKSHGIVHVGRPLGLPTQRSVDRSVDHKQPKNTFFRV